MSDPSLRFDFHPIAGFLRQEVGREMLNCGTFPHVPLSHPSEVRNLNIRTEHGHELASQAIAIAWEE